MIVYLIHFDTPYQHARHYVGFTDGKLKDRLKEHLAGQGAVLIRAVVAAGIGLQVARIWRRRDRKFERRLKQGGSFVRICPVCSGEQALRRYPNAKQYPELTPRYRRENLGNVQKIDGERRLSA